MENVIIIKSVGDINYPVTNDKIMINDIISGQIYMGDSSGVINEIKTEKSNNWAKTFFYGGS
jgi:hypothetical protein